MQPLESRPYRYEPKWEKDVDYNPDHSPSFSRTITSTLGGQPSDVFADGTSPSRVVRVYQVRGVGVIVQTASRSISDDGKLVFDGMSVIAKDELGYCPSL